MLQVITPAVTNDLTVLATVKAELGIFGTTDDAYLDSLIFAVSDGCARYCRRSGWGRETVRQIERLTRCREVIILDRDLLPTISAVTVDGAALAGTDYELDGALLYRLSSDRRVDWAGNKVVIDYQAGFTPLTNLPADLERAALEWIKAAYSARGRDPLLRSQSVQDVGSESYLDPRAGMEAMPPQCAALLDPWRLVAL